MFDTQPNELVPVHRCCKVMQTNDVHTVPRHVAISPLQYATKHGGVSYHTSYSNSLISIGEQCDPAEQNGYVHYLNKYIFAKTSSADGEIYPITVPEIADAQKKHRTFKKVLP